MARIKTVQINDANDLDKMVASVNKVLERLGLKTYFRDLKKPRADWLAANAANGRLDVLIEAQDKLATDHSGPLVVKVKASNGQTSVLSSYTVEATKWALIQQALKANGLI